MRLGVVAIAICMSIVGLAVADDAQASIKKQTNIPAQALAPALEMLARDRNFQIVYVSEEIKDLRTQGAIGEFTSEEALKRLLNGTGLAFRYLDEKTITLVPAAAASPATDRADPSSPVSQPLSPTAEGGKEQEQKRSFFDRFRLAQADQQNPPASSSLTQKESDQNQRSSEQGLEEILITAEKRVASVQDTPISVSAISGAELQAQGVSDMVDAARQVPGLAETTNGPGQTEYTIRGLSSSGPAVATVGFYLDDVPMTAPSGAQNGHVVIDPDLYDLNRVEVLRGPQGTLYGSGSMGGTIKLVTNQPDVRTFSASAQADGSDTLSGGLNGDLNGMVNVPIADGKLALRIVGTDEHTSGWIDRIVLSDFPLPTNPGPQCPGFAGCTRGNVLAAPVSRDYHDVNDEDLKGARASLRYEATEQLTVTASTFYQRISQGGLSYFDDPPGTEAHYQPFDVPESFSDVFRMYNVVANLALPAFDITSATSYWTRSQSQTQDVSETIQSLFDLPSFYIGQGGVGPVSLTEVDDTNQFSEELRLTSTPDSDLQWLIGGFYSDFNYHQDQDSFATGFIPLFGSNDLFSAVFTNHGKQTAAFGEISYKMTRRLKATFGARRYSYTWAGTNTESGIATGSFTPITNYTAAADSGLNPKFTLSYDVAHEFLVYGTVAKGFRPGAGNQPVPVTGSDSCLSSLEALGLTHAPTQYGPDTVLSYEVGEKASLLDNRLTLNSALYYEQWSHVQQTVTLPCAYPYTDNVGTAAVRGGELELNLRLFPSWTIQQTGGYTHAILTSTNSDTGFVPGQRLLNVPTYSASTSIVYSRPIPPYTLVARLSNVLVASQEARSYFLSTLPSYDIANVRIGLTADRWSAFLFVNNVTNKMADLSYAHDYALDFPSVALVATNQPRTIGVTLEYHQ
jgi:outer membrane receptor protein involved in Fe transport